MPLRFYETPPTLTRRLWLFTFLLYSGVWLVNCLTGTLKAQSLKVSYGAKGVQTLSFAGTTLEDVGAWGGDAFHIWHVKCTDLKGNVTSSGQFGWGENNNGESWNPATSTETYTFSWGTISTQFVQQGNNLNIVVTETNNAGSGIILDGAEIYPLALHFPQDPGGFNGYSQFAITTTGPGVSVADFGSGVVTSVIPNEAIPLYGGWKAAGASTYTPILTSTAPDGLAAFLPHNDLPVQPGTTMSFMVSLRFTPEGTPASATDAYSSFAATYPSQITWTDKRIIGTAYLASSPAGSNIQQPGGFPTNPRRYFNDPSVDVTSATGLQAFQSRVLAQAADNVTNSRALSGQGVITWDVEGEQYPQTTSYVCSPDQIASIAPEMESVVSIAGSAYNGKKLVDAYFKTMTSAGLKVGVCLRPQVFTPGQNGTANQIYLTSNSSIISTLEAKAKYANTRWGATIFYVDSTVDVNGGTLDPAIFQQLITDLPSFLFIPEESTPRYYAYSAPFSSFIFHQETGTPAAIYNVYPNAFGATLVNDVSPTVLSNYLPQLTKSVRNGDILMGHADYWQANNPALVAIYQAAGVSPTKPVPVTPVISWSVPPAITYGTPLSSTQLNASTNAPGTFAYIPPAGAVLGAGAQSLLTTFTPSDPMAYSSTTASVPITVTKSIPILTWNAPPAAPYNTPLTAAQLNASANVPGFFVYTPPLGTVLNFGSNTLNATFTPGDVLNYTAAFATVQFSIFSASPQVAWVAPNPITYGTALNSTQLSATASVPGTFTYSPAAGTVLPVGRSSLQVSFAPKDSTNYLTAAASVQLTVNAVKQITPTLNWAAPAAITYGTALSDTQFNATSSVPGSFVYSPPPGTVLSAGSSTLRAVFTPTNISLYQTVSTSAPITVNRATPLTSWATPAAVAYGTALGTAQLNAGSQIPGVFAYAPASGAILNAGANSITAVFTPSDLSNYTPFTITRNLQVLQALPVVSWYAPAPIVVGTALSGTQLNAIGNVPGSFAYAPPAGTQLPAGAQTLGATFTPNDTVNYAATTATVILTVNPLVQNSSLYILTPGINAVVSGSIIVSGQCTLPLDAAGTFLMVDGIGIGTRRVTERPFNYSLDTTTLTNGTHLIQLWAHDIGNNTTISSPVMITVAN